jgi:hypothetical protein
VIPTDVRVVGILRVHHFRTEGALVGHGGALEVLGLHVAEDVFPPRGGEPAEQTDVAGAHRLLPHPRLYDPFPVHRRRLYEKATIVTTRPLGLLLLVRDNKGIVAQDFWGVRTGPKTVRSHF